MNKTQLDLLNEKLMKQAKTREQNVKYFTENREKWNAYQAKYARTRRKTDEEYRERCNATSLRSKAKQKSLVNA